MNLNSLLPLLMGMSGSKNIDPKTLTLIKAMSGKADKDSLISELAGDSSYAPLLKILETQKEKKTAEGGLNAISNIASDDILGKLSRYFYKTKKPKGKN